MRAPSIFSSAATVVVVAAVIAGFFAIGTPGEQRLGRLDQQRVVNLTLILAAIQSYQNRNKALPESLVMVQRSGWQSLILKDPVSGEPYEYKVRDEVSYDLCANFGTESNDADANMNGPSYVPPASPFWHHSRGRQCFTFHAGAK